MIDCCVLLSPTDAYIAAAAGYLLSSAFIYYEESYEFRKCIARK